MSFLLDLNDYASARGSSLVHLDRLTVEACVPPLLETVSTLGFSDPGVDASGEDNHLCHRMFNI